MIERVLLRTAAETATEAAGKSLARSLHAIPLSIGLSGPLGSGKTTFMRGFLREMGVSTAVTSPTYALEQRIDTPNGDIVHVDLYRLNASAARELLRHSEDSPGIRCIEWPEVAGMEDDTDIAVRIEESPDGVRTVHIDCDDVDWPSDDEIDSWRKELLLPDNVAAHCDAVGEFCSAAAHALAEHGTFARPNFARAAGKTHDLLRFVDFQKNAAPAGWEPSARERAAWASWSDTYAGMTHEQAGGRFLRERGYPALAEVVEAHHVRFPVEKRRTTEAHLLYYADKRFIGASQVTVEERYADFANRYGNGSLSADQRRWKDETLETERILFPNGTTL